MEFWRNFYRFEIGGFCLGHRLGVFEVTVYDGNLVLTRGSASGFGRMFGHTAGHFDRWWV